MPEVKVAAEWEDRVSAGFRQLSQNVAQGATTSTRSVQELGTASDRTSEALRRSVASLSSVLGPLATVSGAYIAFRGVLERSIKASIEAETASLRLARIFEVTGQGGERAAKGVEAWASQLANATGVADETISSMVATGVALGQGDAQARKMAEAALILHNRLGRDLQTSFQELIQTLDGSAGRFAKLIPGMDQLTEAELRSGKAADAVAQALGTSESEGVAGALARLKNAIDEDREHLGQMLTGGKRGAEDLAEAINSIVDSINALNKVKLPDLFSTQSLEVLRDQILRQVGAGPSVNPQSRITGDFLSKLPSGALATVALPPDFEQKKLERELADRMAAEKRAKEAAETLANAELEWARFIQQDRLKEAIADVEAARLDRELDFRIARRESLSPPAEKTPEQVGLEVRAGIRANVPQSRVLDDVDRHLEEINKKWLEQLATVDRTIEIGQDLARGFFHELSGGLADAIVGAKSLGDVLKGIFGSFEKKFIEKVFDVAFDAVLKSMFGGLSAPTSPGFGTAIGPISPGPSTANSWTWTTVNNVTPPPRTVEISPASATLIAREIAQSLRADPEQRSIPDGQIMRAVARVLLPEIRTAEARGL